MAQVTTELDPKVRRQIEELVERSDNLRSFEQNVTDMARGHLGLSAYHGEPAYLAHFGREAWMLAPSPCCLCGKTIFGWGRAFWDKLTRDSKYLDPDCHFRWWIAAGPEAA